MIFKEIVYIMLAVKYVSCTDRAVFLCRLYASAAIVVDATRRLLDLLAILFHHIEQICVVAHAHGVARTHVDQVFL